MRENSNALVLVHIGLEVNFDISLILDAKFILAR